MDAPWTWFVMRSSGLVSLGLLTFAVLMGVVGPRLRPTGRLATIGLHRSSAVAGFVLIAGHVVLAVLDRWIALDWPASLVPGAAGWQRWGVALGALAVDLLVALVVTSALRLRHPVAWRRVHWAAYPMWAMVIGHALLVGTDDRVVQVLALASGAAVLAGVAFRLVRRAPTSEVGSLARAGAR